MAEKIKVKKPNFFVYTIPTYIMKFFSRFYWRMKTDNREIRKIKSPILALVPHSSTLDILPVCATLLPKRYNVVMGKDLFTWKQLRPFIKAFGAIPKDQCNIDLACMRQMKAAAESGNNILLYPEGRTSLDGKQMFYLSPAIGKLVRFLGCTVVVVENHGSYLTKPRYIKGFRRGRIETKARVLFTAEEAKTLPAKVLTDRIVEAFRYNDHIWQRENDVVFKAKELASRLDYVLYKCPRCGAEYEMKAEGDTLSCTACNNAVRYTERGALVPIGNSVSLDRIDLWVDYERAEIDKEIADPSFRLEKDVFVQIRNDVTFRYDDCGKGALSIDREKIEFCGTVCGEDTVLTFSLDGVPTVVTKNSEGIDLVIGGVPYRFLFTERKWSTKYGLIVERLFAAKM